jgi:hypothetical protein
MKPYLKNRLKAKTMVVGQMVESVPRTAKIEREREREREREK